ncbi:MAG: hypothetical protein L0Y42_07530 [Phycisphaerales bacterium]|nr:hypothetical protein [Phycisphaerales bacterium]
MTLQLVRVRASVLAMFCASAILWTTSPAMADIVSVNGSAKVTSAPDSLLRNQWEANKKTRIFQERSSFTLTESLAVNITVPGLYFSIGEGSPGSIEAGTTIDSYLLHQDPKGPKHDIILKGKITFDQEIIGIIINNQLLAISDLVLGTDDTIYASGTDNLRHIDSPFLPDRIKITPDGRTLKFRLHTRTAMDEIRIITASAPVPSPGCLALLGLAGAMMSGRRRRSA